MQAFDFPILTQASSIGGRKVPFHDCRRGMVQND
jgi:hypothetical protein